MIDASILIYKVRLGALPDLKQQLVATASMSMRDQVELACARRNEQLMADGINYRFKYTSGECVNAYQPGDDVVL